MVALNEAIDSAPEGTFDKRDIEAEKELMYLVRNAVEYVQNQGYWGMISNYYGNEIPLKYDWS